MIDSGRHATRWRLAKYREDIGPFRGREAAFYALYEPYEVIEGEGNILTSAGVALMLTKLVGGAGTVFDATNARIGVGNSATAASASQTDLQGASTFRGDMDATYPLLTGTTMFWQSSFGPTEANFAWHEWGIFNAASAGTMLNRKVNPFGTKTTGTWALQVGIRIF